MFFKKLKLVSILFIGFFLKSLVVNAQCDPNQKYDKIVSGFHQSIALKQDGTFSVWGEEISNSGAGDVLSPIDLNSTNYPALTGTVLKVSIGGEGGFSSEQAVALTTTGLFAWGNEGKVLSNALTTSAAFQKIKAPTNGDATTKLPIGVSPSDVIMMQASYQTLAILTKSGNVWMLTQASLALEGNGGTASKPGSSLWKKVKTSSATDLTNVIAVRGQVSSNSLNAFAALTSSGKVYTWGSSIYLGNGNASTSASYATLMTLPVEFTSSNVPKMIGVTGGINTNTARKNTYFLLSNNGSLYALGDNSKKQCGDFSVTERKSWVNSKINSSTNFSNVNFISVQEHDAYAPGVSAITLTGDLYTWGENSGLMLGRPTRDAVLDPGLPGGFVSGTDKAIFAELGGHTLVYLKEGSSRFCYVGHKVGGSMGDGTSSNVDLDTFNCSSTPNLAICGSVPVGASIANSTISANPSSIFANGYSTSTLTIQLKDASGNNLTSSGGVVVVSTSQGSLGQVVDNNNGTYTVLLTSSSNAGTATINFKINGNNANNSTTVAFISQTNLSILGCITIVASGGDAVGTTWTYSNNTITPTSATAVSLNASDVLTNLALGNLTVAASCIYVNGAINDGSGSKNLTLKATGNIVVSANIITGGKDITIWTDSDNNGSGGIKIDDNVTLDSRTQTDRTANTNTTSGGKITLAGGLDDAGVSSGVNNLISGLGANDGYPDGYAVNSGSAATQTGIVLGTSTSGTGHNSNIKVYSGGGDIQLHGLATNNSSNTINGPTGLMFFHGYDIDAGTNGNVVLLGNSILTSGGWSIGMDLAAWRSSTSYSANGLIKTHDGSIEVVGRASGGTSGNIAMAIDGDGVNRNIFAATGTGSITLNGLASNTSPLDVRLTNVDLLAKSGNITIVAEGVSGTAIGGYNIGNGLFVGQKASSLVPVSTSNIFINSNVLTTSSKPIDFNTSGTVTVEPFADSFSSAFSLSNITLANTVSALTLGKSTNTANITIGSATTIAGPVNVYGGDISINGNINTSAGNANGDVLLIATGNIVQNSTKSVTTNGGDVIFWSDSDDSGTTTTAGGTISLLDASSITTSGGDIVLAGGADTNADGIPDGYSVGAYATTAHFATNSTAGLFLDNASLNAGAGNVILRGQGTGNLQNFQIGTRLYGGSILGSNITIDSKGSIQGPSSSNWGLSLEGFSIEGSGNIQLTGIGGRAGSFNSDANQVGVEIRRALDNSSKNSQVKATGTGTITINGVGGSGTNADPAVTIPQATGIRIEASQTNPIVSADGDIVLDGTSGRSGRGSALMLGSPISSTNGDISLIGNPSIEGTLNLNGNIEINGAITTGATVSIESPGAVSQTAAIMANNLGLKGTGTFTLNNTSNNIATLAGGNNTTKLGSVSLTDASGGLAIGTVGAESGLTATGAITVETLAGDITLSKDVRTDNTTANAILINAGKTTAIGTATGGNIIVSGSPTVSTGTGGIIKLFSGSDAGSTGLTTFVGGSNNTRSNVDETTSTFSPALTNNGKYALYREAPNCSPNVLFKLSAPNVSTSAIQGQVGTRTENFNSFTDGDVPTSGSYAIGDFTKTGSATTTKYFTNQFYGAPLPNSTTLSRYLGVFSGNVVNVTLTEPSKYLGFWWAGGDAENQVTIFGTCGGNEIQLGQFTTNAITSLLSNPTITAIDGNVYNSSSYKRSSAGNSPFAYINLQLDNPSISFTRLEFTQRSGGGGFEVDNITTGTGYGAASNTTPSAPTITSISATETSLTVNFTAPTSDGGSSITNYEYTTDGGTTWTAFSPTVTSSPVTIIGLVSGTNYPVILRAVNAIGSGAPSNTLTAATVSTLDSDGDGITDINDPDDDNDGIFDSLEQNCSGSTCVDKDTDGDGTPDRLDLDSDGDGVTDAQELADGTSPTDLCSFVLANQTLPTTATWKSTDCDGDGVNNKAELDRNSDPLVSNVAPTNISLSPNAINENAASGSIVGTFSSTDADSGDTHSYTLVAGTGSTDNALFTIDGANLKTTTAFDFETKSSYTIRVRTTDAGGLNFEKAITITVLDVNEAPTNLALSKTSINENNATGTIIGSLSSTDIDSGDTHSYTLVSGIGSTDNALFTIDGANLKTTTAFDFETKSSYTIRVRTTDSGGLNFEKAITITVLDVNEAPTNLALSKTSINENNAIGAIIGELSSTDADAGDTHTYTLVAGTGSTDNAMFSLDGNQLKTKVAFDFEVKSSYTIRVRSTDAGGLSYEKAITITVIDINDTPTDIALSAVSIYEKNAVGAVIGDLSSTDQDAGDKHTYTLVSGDVTAFKISGNQLQANVVYDFGTKSIYDIVVKSTDAGGLTVNKSIRITVLQSPVLFGSANLPQNKQSSATGQNVTISKGYSANLNLNGSNIVKYAWSPSTGLSATNISNPIAKPTQTTTYTVRVTNAQGISTDVYITVIVLDDYNITPNNVLSPDGDGVNDFWTIENLSTYPNNEVKIFDKAGRVIYSVRNYQNNWNGQLNGEILHEGAYYYVINLGPGIRPKIGYITLFSNK